LDIVGDMTVKFDRMNLIHSMPGQSRCFLVILLLQPIIENLSITVNTNSEVLTNAPGIVSHLDFDYNIFHNLYRYPATAHSSR
jgi:hypothetical protein